MRMLGWVPWAYISGEFQYCEACVGLVNCYSLVID